MRSRRDAPRGAAAAERAGCPPPPPPHPPLAEFSTQEERDTHLRKELKALKSSMEKKQQQADTLRRELEGTKSKAGEAVKAAEAARQRCVTPLMSAHPRARAGPLSTTDSPARPADRRLAAHKREAEAAKGRIAELKLKRDQKTDVRKGLWREEQELQQSSKTAQAELDKARRTLQHSMSRAQSEAIAAVKRIAAEQKIAGVHGMLLELFTADSKYFTAIEVAAGSQLFQVVVDNDDVAARMMSELQKANAGRVTFMPLNRLRPGEDPRYPDSEDGFPMLSKMKFDDKFRPAFKQVFRKCLITRTLPFGVKCSRDFNLDCVTLEGDQVNNKGALTGGYLDVRRSRLQAQLDIKRLQEQVGSHGEQQAAISAKVERVDQEVTELIDALQSEETARQKAAAAAELEALDLPAASGGGGRDAHKAADAQKERARAALLSAVESDRERAAALEAELASSFSSELSAEEEAQRGELQARLHQLQRDRVAAEKARSKAEGTRAALETELSEHLQRRQRELEGSLEQMDAEDTAASSEGGAAALAEAQERLETTEAALAESARKRDAARLKERALQSTHDELKTQLAAQRARQREEAKELDKLLSRKALLLQKQEEFTDCIRKLGSLPKDVFEQMHASKSSKQVRSRSALSRDAPDS